MEPRIWTPLLLSTLLLGAACEEVSTPADPEPIPGDECATVSRALPAEHVVRVSETGDFEPSLTCVLPGDTVVWEFEGSPLGHSIIPVNAPEAGATVADSCQDYRPYDPSRPYEITGPMPEAMSGIFSRADNEPGVLAPGELGACERYGPCVPQPGRAFCSGAKLGGTEIITAGECYGARGVCEPEGDATTCVVARREPGNFFYTNHHTTWAEPGVVGVLLVFNWKDIEPARGEFAWEELDRTVQDAVDHGKFFSLVIKADATRTGLPAWLFEPEPGGAGMDPLVFHDKYGQGESCTEARDHDRVSAHVLDYRFKEHYFALLEEIAAHLSERNAHYRALAYIKPSGANLQSPEAHLPAGCLQAEAGLPADNPACECVADNVDEQGIDAALASCGELFTDVDVSCCGLCNDAIWATTPYFEGPDDVEGAFYSAQALVDFFSEQGAVLSEHFPDKSVSYALIQDGFPKVNMPEGANGIWTTMEIMRNGAAEQGVKFVVQHNALNAKVVLGPWIVYRMALDYPEQYEAGLGQSLAEYLQQQVDEGTWEPEAAGDALLDELLNRWEQDAAALAADPEHDPLSAEEFLAALDAAGVDYEDPCLLPDESAPTHPKTPAHYNLYLGGGGSCANAQVILAGSQGQITGKQNNSGLRYTGQFLSSLDNAIDHTDAVFVEAYEGVIQRAMADGADLDAYAQRFHDRRSADWNIWVEDSGWEDRTLPTEPFPQRYSVTLGSFEATEGNRPAEVIHYVQGASCAANPTVGRIVVLQP